MGGADKKRILIIDDEAEFVGLTKLGLEKKGYEVETLTKPAKAVSTALDFRPDAILLDYLMPKVSGSEVLTQLRRIPTFARTPIIFVSAVPPPTNFLVNMEAKEPAESEEDAETGEDSTDEKKAKSGESEPEEEAQEAEEASSGRDEDAPSPTEAGGGALTKPVALDDLVTRIEAELHSHVDPLSSIDT